MAYTGGEEIGNEVDDKIYVAVSKDWKACKSSLEWTIRNSNGRRICLVHVHQPSQYINIMGGKFPVSSLSEHEVTQHREKERQDMCKSLEEYIRICTKAKVQVEKIHIEKETIECGIVELISQHKILRLVMGAAADKSYSRKLMEPKSKKANYVRQYAPPFCHIWFVCKARLIFTREGINQLQLYDEDQRLSSVDLTEESTSFSRINSEASFDRSSLSESATKPEEQEGSMNYVLYNQLDQAMVEAETAKQEAFVESMRRRKAEKDAFEAIRKGNALENFYNEELKRRKELEEVLAKTQEELECAKRQRDLALDELQIAANQKLLLSSRAEKSDRLGNQLEEKLISALELLQSFRKL